MNLFSKCGIALTGLLISFGCLAVDPPCWKLESEGAAPGDVCWFSDKQTSGAVYAMNKVIMKDGKLYCFHEGEEEDRFIKKFGWLNADWNSLRAHFSSQQSIKTFIGSYKWCSDNKETKARPLPAVNASEVSEKTVSLETVIEEGVEYLSLGIMSSTNGQIEQLGKFFKEVKAVSSNMLDIWAFYGCGWAVTGEGGSSHHGRKNYWMNDCFSLAATSCSVDNEGNFQSGNRIAKNNCDGGKNAGFVKFAVPESVLPQEVREFYRKRQAK